MQCQIGTLISQEKDKPYSDKILNAKHDLVPTETSVSSELCPDEKYPPHTIFHTKCIHGV